MTCVVTFAPTELFIYSQVGSITISLLAERRAAILTRIRRWSNRWPTLPDSQSFVRVVKLL